MFIRSITTTAILLAFGSMNAQAVEPSTDSPFSNAFVNIGENFPIAEANPNGQGPYASSQNSSMEERQRDDYRFFSRHDEIFNQPDASRPPMYMGYDANQLGRDFNANANMEPVNFSVARYYDNPSDFQRYVEPQSFQPEIHFYGDPALQRDPSAGAFVPQAVEAKAALNDAGNAPPRLLENPFPGRGQAWSCISFNGTACPPSLHQASLAFGQAPA